MSLRDLIIAGGNQTFAENNLPANAQAADRFNARVGTVLTQNSEPGSLLYDAGRMVGGRPADGSFDRFIGNDPVRAARYYARQAGLNSSTEPNDPGAPAPNSGGSVARSLDYGDYAPYAQFFGMDAATAYAESLANTAHQREVLDLTRAGLNPVLSAIKGSGADVVAGSPASSGHSGAAVEEAPGLFSGSVVSNAVAAAISWLAGNKRAAASALGRAGGALVSNIQAARGKA